jgi:phosphatidylserine decarboxylase
MTEPLVVIDRVTKRPVEEKVWGNGWLSLLYGETLVAQTIGRSLLHLVVRWPAFSWLVGKYYDSAYSCKDIADFCQRFHIDTTEQTLPLDQYTSFNDFFTRRLRPEVRKQDPDPQVITVPADGRYQFFPMIGSTSSFPVKGLNLELEKLLHSAPLAARFYGGVGVLCRLCPADYHRFFFPTEGRAGATSWIHGSLFSVNPIATRHFPWIMWSNRRAITLVELPGRSTMAYIEIGATNCGSIIQEFVPNTWVKKGQEKGFFRLGGSAILLLFEPGRIQLSDDLLELSSSGHEVLCRIGQPLGRLISGEG